MNNRDLATTLTKLGGVALIIYAILNAAASIPYSIAAPKDVATELLASVYLTKVILPAVIGFLMVYFGGILVGRHMPNTEINPETLDNLEKTALSVMGVFLFYQAASDMVALLSSLYKINSMMKSGIPTSYESMNVNTFAAIVATVFEVAVSCWLIFGSSGMVNLFNRFRGR